MAPEHINGNASSTASLKQADEHLKSIIQSLFNIIVQAHDHQGADSERAMQNQIHQLINSLISLRDVSPAIDAQIPPELIDYVQRGRNPDIYTREFVELVMEMNQRLRGKSEAFAAFRDVLADEMVRGIDGLEGGVREVMERSGAARA